VQSRRDTTVARPDAMTGRTLEGRYLLGERIARGGMASVYLGTDIRLDRTVAVKIMHPGLGDDAEFAARFVREARSAARLSHPHIVAIHDQGTDEGIAFLAMEYVPGQTLRDVIADSAPLAPTRALAILEPVVSAIAAAHRAGLIHRDVKPENVLVSDDRSVVKVADFGLAKAISADTQHTVTGGVLIGTVSYLAPELVTDGKADERADVYALGVLLFELLTGQKPHEGETPIAVAYKHVHADVPAPSTVAEDIPDYVDALVARATSRDRTQRPADAGVLLHLVRRVSQALRDGVETDDDLTADLRPRPVCVDSGEAHRPEDTIPVAAPEAAFFSGREPEIAPPVPREHTTTIEATSREDAHEVVPASPRPVAHPTGRAPSPPRSVVVQPRSRSRRGPIVLLLMLALIAGLTGAGYWWAVARYTSTPALLGLTAQQADAKLAKAGLQGREGPPDFSETVPAGQVLRTDPEPSARVLDHGTVTLILSLGKERYDVPPLKGKTEDAAQDALQDTHLSFGKSLARWHEEIPAGQVIRSIPPAGKTLRPGTAVDLVVSKGPKPISIKDWTGKNAARATSAMQAKGLVVTVTDEVFSDTVDEGKVISQTPASGTLHKGDEVTLTVSKGPELIEVPGGLKSSGVADATAKLEALEFVVRTEPSAIYLGLGYVSGSDPGSGAMVPKGSTITLYLV
jgi:serine/threonine protein kinase/beta-lactam-binding protein with PASTA domain